MAKQGWRPGVWSAICDRCGFEYNSDQIQTEWTGLKVCSKCWESRHPQDLIRVQPEKIVPPWTRPEQEDVFTYVCDQCTSSAYTGLAAAGCATVGNTPSHELLETYAECVPDGFEWPETFSISGRVLVGDSRVTLLDIPAPLTSSVGELLMVWHVKEGATPATAPGWTTIGSTTHGGSALILTVLAKVATGSDTCSITSSLVWQSALGWSFSGSTSLGNIVTFFNDTPPYNILVQCPTITSQPRDFFAIVGAGFDGAHSPSAYPLGYSNGQTTGPTTPSWHPIVFAAEKLCVPGSETPGTFTVDSAVPGFADYVNLSVAVLRD